ncbi:hypothetical protein FXO38_34034 [Capsicum annuum]|nr:hypothetical protein FXO38_34034 [Capsicum annuum]
MGRDEPERQRAESQWIVVARPLCHLQYPVAYLSRLHRILPTAQWKLYFKAATTTLPPPRLSQRHVPLGAEAPTCHGALVPWCLGAMLPRCVGAMVPRCPCATVPRCLGATVPWCRGAVLQCLGAMVPRCHGAMVPWCHGALVPSWPNTICPSAFVIGAALRLTVTKTSNCDMPPCTDVVLDASLSTYG